MALTKYQHEILALLARLRIFKQESYLAGGAALTEATSSPRLSRDIDLFHDTQEALLSTWEEDRRILSDGGYVVETRVELPAFVEAVVRKDSQAVLVQWAVDSAFRFFPLVKGPADLPALHPFDLATNKALALIGRLEPRDWIDLIACHHKIQHVGLLCWAASGKDPGTNPTLILSEAGRSGRYTQEELNGLAFDGEAPDAALLAVQWKSMLAEARDAISKLPVTEVGACVLDADGSLFHGNIVRLEESLARGALRFHRGSIRGSMPRLVAQ